MKDGISKQYGQGTFITMVHDDEVYLRMQCPAITAAAKLLDLEVDYVWYERSTNGWDSRGQGKKLEEVYQALLKEEQA